MPFRYRTTRSSLSGDDAVGYLKRPPPQLVATARREKTSERRSPMAGVSPRRWSPSRGRPAYRRAMSATRIVALHPFSLNGPAMRAQVAPLLPAREIVAPDAPHTCSAESVDRLYAVWDVP